MFLIDSHCHLDHFPEEERGAVLARAAAAQVREVVTIGTRLGQSAEMRAYAERTAGVWCTVGVHPHEAGAVPMASVEALVGLADSPKVVGIGESGLDYHYDTAPRESQKASFRVHIEAARRTGLPIAIHARAADDDIATILEEEAGQGAYALLLHCFSSGRGRAARALALGGYVSFSGILTFPKSEELRAIAREVPAERLLVETDSPFLAPVPHRGKRCEPAMVADTAAVLARVRGMEVAALAELTTANFRRLFRRAG